MGCSNIKNDIDVISFLISRKKYIFEFLDFLNKTFGVVARTFVFGCTKPLNLKISQNICS
jgi:hypothetical protein